MAQVKLIFFDTEEKNQLEVFSDINQGVTLLIQSEHTISQPPQIVRIGLDIPTAVKFSKELRRQIAVSKSITELK